MKYSAYCTTQSKTAQFAYTLLVTVAFHLIPMAWGQEDLSTKLQRVAEQSSLDAAGMKPWHLKLSYLSVTGGGEDGSIEEWWAGPDRWRQEWTSGGTTRVVVRTAEGQFSSKADQPVSQAAQLLYQQVVHPIDKDDVVGATPEAKPFKIGSLTLNCVMLSQPIKGVPNLPLGLFPTYCLEGDTLRISRLATDTSVITQKIGKFQGHTVSVKVQVSAGGKLNFEGTVDQLATFTPEHAQFVTTDLVKGPPGDVGVSGGVMQGRLKNRVQPVYPASALQARTTGTVVMLAKIGEDGMVHRLRIVSSPDRDLSLAALIAVQQWTYTPYLLNGVPTVVNTTITVNFRLR